MIGLIDATIAKQFNIKVKQNQTFNALFAFTLEDNSPFSLAGATAKLSVRDNGCSSSCGCDFDNGLDLIYKQDFLGQIIGTDFNEIEFSEVVKLSPGSYKYDLLIYLNESLQFYLLTGSFIVKRSYAV